MRNTNGWNSTNCMYAQQTGGMGQRETCNPAGSRNGGDGFSASIFVVTSSNASHTPKLSEQNGKWKHHTRKQSIQISYNDYTHRLDPRKQSVHALSVPQCRNTKPSRRHTNCMVCHLFPTIYHQLIGLIMLIWGAHTFCRINHLRPVSLPKL